MNKQNNAIGGKLTLKNRYVRENNEEGKYKYKYRHYQWLIILCQI